MDRRTFLAGSATAGTLGLAGCLGVLGGSSTANVVLSPPENYDRLRESRDEGYLAYPIHGDELPAVTLPAALADRRISTREFVGERHVMLTFIFTRCNGPCQRLTSTLAQVQNKAINGGYVSDLAFLPTTFDPEYDTPARLREFGTARSAVLDSDSWYFLRPRTDERVSEVVEGTFGVFVDRVEDQQSGNATASYGLGSTNTAARPLHEDHDNSTGNETRGGHVQFNHLSMILLANKDGYVERTYTGTGSSLPGGGGLLSDVETLRDEW
jgi:protein SCO1/2